MWGRTMAEKIKSSPAAFNRLEKLLKPYEKAGRNPSSDFLIWFLETIYRLDDVEARDAICDQSNDAGIDAITVDELSRSVVVFQSKRREKSDKTLGDTDLKAFVGSLKQFHGKKNVDALLKTATLSSELRGHSSQQRDRHIYQEQRRASEFSCQRNVRMSPITAT